MFKKFLVLFVLISAISVYLYGQDSVKKTEFRKISQNAFKNSERFTFDINYGFITAGEAIMEISPNYQVINGRTCYDIYIGVNSSPSFEWIYKVRDTYKCYLDKEGIFPWRFEQHIREGNFKKDFEAIFDHENLKVKTYTGEKEPKKFEGEYNIPLYVQDIISAFYYFRTQDHTTMKDGDIIKMQNFYDDKVYPLDVKVYGIETVKVPAGKFRCRKIEPLVKEGGLFKSEGGIILWITDDERRMPVKVETRVIIGSMNVELTEYKNLAGPLNSKVDK